MIFNAFVWMFLTLQSFSWQDLKQTWLSSTFLLLRGGVKPRGLEWHGEAIKKEGQVEPLVPCRSLAFHYQVHPVPQSPVSVMHISTCESFLHWNCNVWAHPRRHTPAVPFHLQLLGPLTSTQLSFPKEGPHLSVPGNWWEHAHFAVIGLAFRDSPACLSYPLGPWSKLQLPGNEDAVICIILSSFALLSCLHSENNPLTWSRLQGLLSHGTAPCSLLCDDLRVPSTMRVKQINHAEVKCCVSWNAKKSLEIFLTKRNILMNISHLKYFSNFFVSSFFF